MVIFALEAPAQPIERRNFLKSLSLLVGGLGRTQIPTPPTPAVVKQASEALIERRSIYIAKTYRSGHLLNLDRSWADVLTDPLPTGFRVTVENWVHQDPAGRAHVRKELRDLSDVGRRLIELRGESAWTDEQEDEFALLDGDFDARKSALKAQIKEWPWSEFDIGLMLSEPIARAESAIAAELDVDVGLVQDLTDHIMTISDDEQMRIFENLASERPRKTAGPIYSSRTLEVFARHMEPLCKGVAANVHYQNSIAALNSLKIRRGLTASSGHFFRWRPEAFFNFDFGRRLGGLYLRAGVSELAPLYARGLEHFARLHARLHQLKDSPLRKIALVEVADLERLLAEELRNLPILIATQRAAYFERHPEKVDDLETGDTKTFDAATWAHTLVTLGQTWPAVARMMDRVTGESPDSLNAGCTDALEGSVVPHARLEHQPELSLDLGETVRERIKTSDGAE